MNDIDNIFKQAAQNKKGEFKPAYWDEMAVLINKDKKKRRGFIWFFIGAGIVLLIGVGIFYASKETNNNNLAHKYTPREIKTELEVKNETIQQIENELISSTDKSLVNHINNTYKETENTIVQNGHLNKAHKKNEQTENINNTIKTNLASESLNNTHKHSIDNNETKGFATTNNTFGEAKPITFTSNIIEEYSSIELDKMPLSNYASPNSEVTAQEEVPQIASTPFTRHSVNVLLGISLYDDFNVASKEIDLKTGFVGGVEYVYGFNDKLSLSTQIKGYNRKSSNARLLFNTSEQSFGETTKEAIYDYSNLYFVEIPLSLNYHLAQKHRVGLGVNYTRLITTKVNVVKQRSELFLNTQTSQTSQQYVYHFDTFTLNNYGVNINYEYNLNRFKVGLEYSFGINNFINKQTFKTNYNNSLNQLNFILKYNVFKIEK